MKEKPILFNGEMVRAILAGRKTQTRRVIKPQPKTPQFEHLGVGITGLWCGYTPSWHGGPRVWEARCPYGKPGDQLWVRETFAELCELADPWCECEDEAPDNPHHFIEYRADSFNKYPGQWDDAFTDEIEHAKEEGYLPRWKPSIFMPRWASRIQLRVESVRVERVRDISEEDALAEGCIPWVENGQEVDSARSDFAQLWNSINEERGFGWEKDPWVWVVEFSVIEEE